MTTSKVVDYDPCIYLNGTPIQRTNKYKYLGVHIDDNLKYQSHIINLDTKLSQFCGISYRLRNHFSPLSAKSYYYACVYSILTYCICVWGGVMKCSRRADHLVKLQERIIRNIFHKYHREYTTCIFKTHKMLKLPDIHTLYIGIYMYKINKLNRCPTLNSNLNLSYPSHDYETRRRNDLVLPFPRIETLRQNYKYQCSNIWNEIPMHIRDSRTLSVFKKTLTQYLLDKY